MGTTLDSLDNIITSFQNNGGWHRYYTALTPATVAGATTTSGYITSQYIGTDIAVPSVGAGLTGMYITNCHMTSITGTILLVCALKYELGTLTVSGNSFVDGVAMPTKSLRLKQQSASIQTAAQMAFAVVTTTMVATAPVLTITYVDQGGNGSQTSTLTLPTSAGIGSAFLIDPHLANGDSGIRDITNLSISTGTAGVIKIHGLLILGIATVSNISGAIPTTPLAEARPMWLCEAGEQIGFYALGTSSSQRIWASLTGVAEN